jgi:hypothetical protein
MKSLFLVLALTGAALTAAPVINSSTIRVDHLSHSSLHLTYQLSSGSPNQGRIRWIASPGTCTGGSGGTVETDVWNPGQDDHWWHLIVGSNSWYAQPLHGLSPGTAYQVCPEVSNGDGTWSTGAGLTVTTTALPAIHPALPTPPQRFNTDYPDTTGYHPVPITNDSDCSKLATAINTAIAQPDRNSVGTVITLTHGSTCTGQFYLNQFSADTVVLNPSAFNLSTHIVTTSSPVTEGQALVWGATNGQTPNLPNASGIGSRGYLPGYRDENNNGEANTYQDGSGVPSNQLPMMANEVTYAHITCSGCNSTHFQVYAHAPFSAGLCPSNQTNPISDSGSIYSVGQKCPTLWSFDNQGSGNILYAPWPRPVKPIIIQSDAVANGTFVPEHVRPQGATDANGNPTPPTMWANQMARIQLPNSLLGDRNTGRKKMIYFIGYGGDANNQYFVANLRFVGIEFTYQPYPSANYLQDPPPGNSLLSMTMDSSGIILDRCWLHGYDAPFRTYQGLGWDGQSQAIVDSYINDMHFPRQINLGYGSATNDYGLQVSSNQKTVTISSGQSQFGSVPYDQPSNISFTVSGASASGTTSGYMYWDIFGKLNITLPPGVSGTCTGGPCLIYTTDSTKGASQYGGSSARPGNINDGLYWIDPVFNTTNTTNGATSLMANVPPPLPGSAIGFAAGPGNTAGLRFQSSSAGFLVSARFYKQPSSLDTSSSVVVNLSDDAGNSKGSTTITYASSASGWQTANFSPAIPVTANTYYQIWIVTQTGGGYPWQNKFLANYRLSNGTLSTAATFDGSGGGCNTFGAWPKEPLGFGGGDSYGVGVGMIGCVDYSTTGSLNAYGADTETDRWSGTEGCQCMQGGKGPGPYALVNTVIDNSGNQWHHDNAGGYRNRADFWYYRDVFMWQPSLRTGAPGASRFKYTSRQLLEWKAGRRIHIEGTRFSYAWNDGQASSLMLVPANKDGGAGDLWVGNNEFSHGPGVTQVCGQYEEGPPMARCTFTNNLFWDISGYGSAGLGGYGDQFSGTGHAYVFQGGTGSEDVIIDHNTIFPLRGDVSDLIEIGVGDRPFDSREGLQVTNNIFPVSDIGGKYGLYDEAQCASGGEAVAGPSCANWQRYTWTNNLMYPSVWSFSDHITRIGPFDMASTATQASVQNHYPTWKNSNYIPLSTDLTTYGFFKLPSFQSTSATWSTPPDGHLKHTSILLATGSNKPKDGKDLGADLNAIEAAEGKVQSVSVPNSLMTNNSATVTFVAPDAQACPVDYAIANSGDPYLTNSFQRASDPAAGLNRSVQITGLTSGAVYRFRVDCAAVQPMGLFRVK